jgi:glutamate--cysteine ligase
LCALPALWVGLLYDDSALDAAWDMVRDWTPEEHLHLRAEVPRLALRTPFRSGTVRDLALATLELAAAGLRARARTDGAGRDERHFLEPLWEIARRGVTPAEDKLADFHGRWGGSVDPVFREHAY